MGAAQAVRAALDQKAVRFKAFDYAARVIAAFKKQDVLTKLLEPVGCDKPCDARAYDDGVESHTKLECTRKYLLLHRLLVQISVKDHRHVAYEDASERGNFDAVATQSHHTIALQFSQARQFQSKMLIENNVELALDFRFDDQAMTEQPIDDQTAQFIFRTHTHSAHSRPLAAVQRRVVIRQVTPV